MRQYFWLIIIILILCVLYSNQYVQAEELDPENEEYQETIEENLEIIEDEEDENENESELPQDIIEDDELDVSVRVPLSVEYGVLINISVSETYTDEYGQLFLLYSPEEQYSGEVIFDCSYEHVELYVNGDPLIYLDSIQENRTYSISFSFAEQPSNVMFTASGERKQVDAVFPGEHVDDVDSGNVSPSLQDMVLMKEEIRSLRRELEQLSEYTYSIQTGYKNDTLDFLVSNEEIISGDAETQFMEYITEMQISIEAMQEKLDALTEKSGQWMMPAEQKDMSNEAISVVDDKNSTPDKYRIEVPWKFIVVVLALTYIIGRIVNRH